MTAPTETTVVVLAPTREEKPWPLILCFEGWLDQQLDHQPLRQTAVTPLKQRMSDSAYRTGPTPDHDTRSQTCN